MREDVVILPICKLDELYFISTSQQHFSLLQEDCSTDEEFKGVIGIRQGHLRPDFTFCIFRKKDCR